MPSKKIEFVSSGMLSQSTKAIKETSYLTYIIIAFLICISGIQAW
jgi:hypothetical protein